MIIVSQDKDAIVNFDRTQNIWIDSNVLDKTNTTFDIVADDEALGSYETEKRAKEILQEIAERYGNWKNLEYGQPSGMCNPIYEMPTE